MGSIGNLFDDGNCLRDFFDRSYRFNHGLTAFLSIFGCLQRNQFRLLGIIGILRDVGHHLFHGRGNFFRRGGLLRAALRHSRRAVAKLLAAACRFPARFLHMIEHFDQCIFHLSKRSA